MLNLFFFLSLWAMRRFTCITVTILLCGSLFFAQAAENHSVNTTPMYSSPFSYHFHPDYLNTFNTLFPIYSYQKEVCRKPYTGNFLFMEDHFTPFSAHYNYKGFTFKTTKLGSHFLKVDGNSIYKEGNSLLLIPRSFIAPVKPPAFRPDMPKMVVPKVD